MIPGYILRAGSGLDRALLVKFMRSTYGELYPDQSFAHLAQTVEQYFSRDTRLWWVDVEAPPKFSKVDPASMDSLIADSLIVDSLTDVHVPASSSLPSPSKPTAPTTITLASPSPIACLWMGTAIDQVMGWRYPHIFLLYVAPQHRRQGIGSALMAHAEAWARAQGGRQIGLQVFQQNQPALDLYTKLGYQPQAISMVKPISS